MANCKFSTVPNFNCESLVVGGLKQDFYMGNLSDLDEIAPFTIDPISGYITAINFAGTATQGLYKFEAPKDSHLFGIETGRTEGGAPFYTQTFTPKLFEATPADTESLEDIAKSIVFAIVETNSKKFRLVGSDGLQLTAGSQSSGQNAQADTRETLTLVSIQATRASWVLDTDYATTKALLESYVVN